MKTNISPLNRGVRVVIGIVMIVVSVFFLAKLNLILLGIGGILVLTGLIGFCPIDSYFHMKRQP